MCQRACCDEAETRAGGGLGRAGTIAARLLIELDMEPPKAIVLGGGARPGDIETSAQEIFVLGLSSTRG